MDFPKQLKAPKFLQEHYSQIISQEKKEPQVQCELRALRENGGDLLSRANSANKQYHRRDCA